MTCLTYTGGEQGVFPCLCFFSVAFTQNQPDFKVAYFGVAYSAGLQAHGKSEWDIHISYMLSVWKYIYLSIYLSIYIIYVCVYIYIYGDIYVIYVDKICIHDIHPYRYVIYMCVCVCVCVYIYMYAYRGEERKRLELWCLVVSYQEYYQRDYQIGWEFEDGILRSSENGKININSN